MKKSVNIVLFGGGLHANCCIDIIEHYSQFKIIGIIDSVLDVGSIQFGYPVIGRQNNLVNLVKEYHFNSGLIAIGDNWFRKIVYNDIIKQIPTFHFINALHPSLIVGRGVTMGIGVVTMAGCIINPGAVIGNFCFFATGAQIEHDSLIGDFASISAGSITGGKVIIGELSAITLGVTILDRITIGSNTVIGSGSLVLNDIPDDVLAYGYPARIIRTRAKGEKFLKAR